MVRTEMVGTEFAPFAYDLERAKIREFAIALDEKDPVYHNPEEARLAGYDDLPVPIGYLLHVTVHDSRDLFAQVGIDFDRAVFGGLEQDFLEPIQAGDTVSGRVRVADIQQKQSRHGSVVIVTWEIEYKNQHGRVVLRERSQAVQRV